MKVSLNWIKEYVDVNLPPSELANLLTMAGSEVKDTQIIGSNWEGIIVGQIKAINPHPNADRLTLVTINLDTRDETVVCGAPNLRLDDKVAYAPVGVKLINPHTGELAELKQAKIRGVVSSGMACSEKELGISDEHEGILILPPEAEIGKPLSDYYGDAIYNMDITPNRPDCLSMIGLAREAAALTGGKMHLPSLDYAESSDRIEDAIKVEIAAPDLCPRYCASLITGVKVGESPKWIQERLLSYGMRPINNIVDVTNFVMLEYGQPLHAFDYECIRDKKIIVRRAENGEKIISLDDVERTLSNETLVIADGHRAVAVAGVMGGTNSEVTESTTSILLEAASFNPASIHYTGRTHNMPSEACMRFERGISPELTVPALRRATQLIAELGGGEAVSGIVDEYPGKKDPVSIKISTSEVKRVLGVEFSLKQITDNLTALGFECRPGTTDDEIMATVPDWRTDISITVDLIEEIARTVGYDEIPVTMISQAIPRHKPEPVIDFKRKLREMFRGYGFQEIVSYSLTSLDSLKKLVPESGNIDPMPLRLVNPMTIDMEYLRPNLRPFLLSALSDNKKNTDGSIRLFELGKVFLPREKDLPLEDETVCGILNGNSTDGWWQNDARPLDFYDAKGIIEGVLGQLGLEVVFERSGDESLHPLKQASIVVNDCALGVVGELHPGVMENYDIDSVTYLFEINVARLLTVASKYKIYQQIPRYPATIRDIALVVDADVPFQKIKDIITDFSLVADVSLFDVYSGDQVPPGKKSLACRITYQSADHTLADKQVSGLQKQILKKLARELGATLRI